MIRPFGEAALLVEIEETDAASRASRIAALAATVEEGAGGVLAAIPGLTSLVVRFDPDRTAASWLRSQLEPLIADAQSVSAAPRERVIPVCYDGDDLASAAASAGLGPEEFAERHATLALNVLFLGFAPGFPYLGEMPTELAVPRLPTPRASTPAGSVAVAGRMTGIYPTASPGGWRVIGRTPLRLFDAAREPPAYLLPGDRVRFHAVSSDETARLDDLPPDW